MKRFAVCALLMLVGCNAPKDTMPVPAPAPAHQGKLPEEPIDWDLAGTWSAWRYQDEEGKSKLGRWEVKWILVKDGDGYKDANGQGTFLLSQEILDGRKSRAQVLRWARPDGSVLYLSINDQSFGFLKAMTGSDGELYSAVRSD